MKRLSEEYRALIAYVEANKASGNDWVTLDADDELGTKWSGTARFNFEHLTYEFALRFDVPGTHQRTLAHTSLC